MTFHRNGTTEMGLVSSTKVLLANPPLPFEYEKHEKICSELFTERAYSQKYYLEVYKPRLAALRAAAANNDKEIPKELKSRVRKITTVNSW